MSPSAERYELPALFDAHLHPDGLRDEDLESMRHFGVEAALVPAHHGPPEPTAKRVLETLDRVVGNELLRLRRAGIRGYAAVGVHPTAIPRRGLGEVLEALPGYFRGGQVVALGEIGLHRGGGEEEEAFVEQLQLARRLKLRVLVHTPVKDKERLTRRALSLLRSSGIHPSRVLVDHASGRTLRLVLECGHHAGLTLHPDELTAERAVAIIRRHGSERLVMNSDSGDGAGDILGLARGARLLVKAGLSSKVVARVTRDNISRFLGLAGGGGRTA